MNKIVHLSAFIFLLGFIQLEAFGSDKDDFTTCKKSMTNAHILNSYELWEGAKYCSKVKEIFNSTFLLLTGQIRAMTDMSILIASTDEEEIKASELYGMLYYKTGGSGFDEIYRDEVQKNKLFDSLLSWSATLSETYSPGWEYKHNFSNEKYEQMLTCQKATRIAQLNWYSSLIHNDEYYNASNELNAFMLKHGSTVTAGTETAKERSLIMSRMRDASAGITKPSSQPKECEFAMKYEPNPDSDFTQLYKGANGLKNSGALVFESKAEVSDSWIANSLTSEDLVNILEKIDFETQILVSLNFGKRQNATGAIYISDIDYNSVHENLSISGMLGVNESNCKEPYIETYPFALAVAPRPTIVPTYPGMFVQNFPDGCKPVMSSLNK